MRCAVNELEAWFFETVCMYDYNFGTVWAFRYWLTKVDRLGTMITYFFVNTNHYTILGWPLSPGNSSICCSGTSLLSWVMINTIFNTPNKNSISLSINMKNIINTVLCSSRWVIPSRIWNQDSSIVFKKMESVLSFLWLGRVADRTIKNTSRCQITAGIYLKFSPGAMLRICSTCTGFWWNGPVS